MLKKIKKMKLKDYYNLFKLCILYIPGLILKFFHRDIWIISENGNDAKDNGYVFFKYMMKNHPNVKCYYVIEKSSKDYNKLLEYKGNLLIHNSIKNVIYTIACKNYISSQLASSFPYSNIFFNLYMKKIFGFNYIFLQHGITQEKVECFYKKESNINLFCCAANPEYKYVRDFFGYKDNEVVKTGFCRYDELNDKIDKNDSILFMPTWRKELEIKGNKISDEEEKKFLDSDYYKKIQKLIDNKDIIKSLYKNNKKLYLCLHDNAICYKKYFKTNSKNIIIIDKNSEKNVNVLIRECSFLITDISSVAFDFAYQNKRILYYHFDYDKMLKTHWEKGYFDYENDGFGIVVRSESDCVSEILRAINENFVNPNLYSKRNQNFFIYRDSNNCYRTYKSINKIQKNNDLEYVKRKEKKVSIINSILIILSLILMVYGSINSNYKIMLFSNYMLLLNNFLYFFLDFKKNIYLIMFNFSMFTFLLSKPLIQTICGIKWWVNHSQVSVSLSLKTIWISLMFIFIGAKLCNLIMTKKKKLNIKCNKNNLKKKHIRDDVLKISGLAFYFSIIFKYIVEIEKLIIMSGKDYAEFYISYQSNLSSIIHLFSGMAITFLMIFLVFLPSKKIVFLNLLIYIFSLIPNLIIGQRNPIILMIIFSFTYFVFRDYLNKKEKWIGVKEKLFIIILLPLAIIALDTHNYIRSNEKAEKNIGDTFVDFFYTQGVSFDVLIIGYDKMSEIRSMKKNYVFGPVIDYYRDNTIARKIFKLPGLGLGNNEKRALNGNSFTHILAYLSRSDYLEGHGYGSSYILELYCNYGLVGIILFSSALGLYFSLIPNIIVKKNLLSIICLQSITSIFFLPRSETLSSLMFIFTPHFWISIIIILIFYFIKNKYWRYKNEN